jgi:tRNA threonylcarbamoyladenosine biosynthesis protein TsaE
MTWHILRMSIAAALHLTSPTPETTAQIAERLGQQLGAGDVILLSGPVGAGKSHFARALIQSRLTALGRAEDVPSPTFTIVQSYDLDGLELWHADLYRLTDPSECDELGLTDAFESAICLVEWPDRLGALVPEDALHLTLRPEGDRRELRFDATTPRWQDRLKALMQP